MSTPKLPFFLFFLAIWSFNLAHGVSRNAPAPSPAVDCSNLVLNMADCLSFVSNGNKLKTPQGSCCSGLKTVLKTNAWCLCESFNNRDKLGFDINITRAFNLPTACGVSSPPAPTCGLSLSPNGAPALSPESSALSPNMAARANERAPAPSRGDSRSSTLALSIASVAFSIFIGSFSSL